jgi:hypothetical protein
VALVVAESGIAPIVVALTPDTKRAPARRAKRQRVFICPRTRPLAAASRASATASEGVIAD